jgi:ACS family hexuronate transporter-like MFS transporter
MKPTIQLDSGRSEAIASRWTVGRARAVILTLLFICTVINYVDRQTLSILAPTLRLELHLSETDYADVVSAFLISYTVMYSVSGRLLDRIGARIGLAACIGWWSLATMLTAKAWNAASLALYRFLLGVGEPGVFPAGVKVCGEWFLRRQRAFAIGFFSSGSAIGAIFAPPLIAWITLRYGWRMAFLLPGLVGLLWIPLWLLVYRPPERHAAVSPENLRAMREESELAPSNSLRQLLRQRRVWALVAPRLISDPVWYLYLFWTPDYLQRARGMSLKEIGLYGWIPFLFADLGSVGGGALSDLLIRRGWAPQRARIALLVGVGCLAPLGALVGFVQTTAAAIAFICLAAFLCQCWATNTSALATETFQPAELGTVAGVMGTAGSLGGALFSQLLGRAIGVFGYSSAFVLGAVMHPVAITVLILMFRERRRKNWSTSGQ